MVDDVIPDDVRDFILRHIDSVAQLEALLLLRANSSENWDAARAAARLYTSEEQIQAVLTQLCADGLLSTNDNVYRYECPPETKSTIDRLADAYRRHLIPVTNVVHTKPSRIREFANAFKFRKDP
jgi:hypothetical protein